MLNQDKLTRGAAFDLLEDHGKLASLEWRYEKAILLRRACLIAGAGLLILAAYALIQAALFWEWFQFWHSAVGVFLGLAAMNAGTALLLVWCSLRRDPKAGRPFQGTLEEGENTLQWMRELFY